MNVNFKLGNPDDLTAEVTIRASVFDIREAVKQLNEEFSPRTIPWPLSNIVNTLTNVIGAAEKHFYESASDKPASTRESDHE